MFRAAMPSQDFEHGNPFGGQLRRAPAHGATSRRGEQGEREFSACCAIPLSYAAVPATEGSGGKQD
jgi:hypothetical protein